MSTIRVLHILHSMNRGGAENAIMNYYRHIDRDKVQFDFLLTETDKCAFEDEIIALGGRVYRVPLLTLKNPYAYCKAVRLFYKSHTEYKIVHSHTSSKSFLPLYIAKRNGIPIRIAHSHNSKSESGIRGTIRDFFKLPLRMVVTDLCACGEEAAKWLYGEAVFNTGIVRIVPNVIETQAYDYSENVRQQVRNRLGVQSSSIILGSVARFSVQKNHAFIIEIFKSFHAQVPDSYLLLLGDGDLKSEIQRQVKEASLSDYVIFAGVVPNVGDYEQAMDFFLLPSFNEGLPLSLVEAQVSGLRCFASEGVPKEADKTGLVSFLPLSRGPEYWAKAIADSIGYNRRSHIEDIRAAGYDAHISAAKLEQFYLDAYYTRVLK